MKYFLFLFRDISQSFSTVSKTQQKPGYLHKQLLSTLTLLYIHLPKTKKHNLNVDVLVYHPVLEISAVALYCSKLILLFKHFLSPSFFFPPCLFLSVISFSFRTFTFSEVQELLLVFPLLPLLLHLFRNVFTLDLTPLSLNQTPILPSFFPLLSSLDEKPVSGAKQI